MSERSFVTPSEVSVFRNVYDSSSVFYANSAVEASNIGHRILNASGILGQAVAEAPLELRADTIADPLGRPWYVRYDAPSHDIPNLYDISGALLNFTFTQIDTGFSVGARVNTSVDDAAGIVPTLEAAAGVSTQVFERLVTLGYDHPLTTIRAASELAIDDATRSINEQAKRRTFAGLLDRISKADLNLERENASTLAYIEKAIPDAMLHVNILRAQTQLGVLGADQLGIALANVAKAVYMQSTASRQTQLIDAASAELQGPDTFTFGPKQLHAPMSGNRLHVPVEWRGPVLDERLTVTAELEMDGTYDLHEHTFTPAERGRSLSGIKFILRRAAVTADSTEASLGPVLVAQMRAIAGDRITPEMIDEYTRSLQAEPVPYPTNSGEVKVEAEHRPTFKHSNNRITEYFDE